MKSPRFSAALCGLGLSVDSRVVGLVDFRWRHQPKNAAQAPVAVPGVDPAGGDVLDVTDAPVGPGAEDRRADALGLVEPDHPSS